MFIVVCPALFPQVERDYPEEFNAREVDKLCYRYPEGEG